MDVETETHRDQEICRMSKLRLINTTKLLGYRDRDSSRLRNFLDVETETHRDWEISGMSRPRLIETEKFLGCRDQDQEMFWMSRPRPLETGQKMSIPRLHRDPCWSLPPHYVHHQRGLGCFGYCLQKVRLAILRHDLSETVILFIDHTILGSTCYKGLSAQHFLAYFFWAETLRESLQNSFKHDTYWGRLRRNVLVPQNVFRLVNDTIPLRTARSVGLDY